MSGLVQDLRYALRQLRKSPGFTTIAVLTLAIGIGTNTTFFSVIDGLLLRPPANITAPDRLVTLYQTLAKGGPDGYIPTWSYLDYSYFENHNVVFSELAAYSLVPVSVGVEGSSEQTFGEIVSGNYFVTRGTEPFLGRFFVPKQDDDTEASSLVAVVSYEFWRNRLASNPTVVGKPLMINGHIYTVIGVAPKDTSDVGLQMAPALWVPLSAQPALNWPEKGALTNRGTGWLTVLGRLKQGVSRQQATLNLSSLAHQLDLEYPGVEQGRGVSVETATSLPPFFRGSVIGFVAMLQVLGALLLLIPCANVAGLISARSWSRRDEIMMRVAVGATRGRIIRQLLTESVLMGLISGVMGLFLVLSGGAFLSRLKPPVDLPISLKLVADIRVLGFTLIVVLMTVVLFGMFPALRLSRISLVPKVGRGSDPGSGRSSTNGRNLLLVSQVTVSFMLLIGAGLCVRSLLNAERLDPGFDTENVLSFSLSPTLNGYTKGTTAAFYRSLLERLRSLAGVRSVSMAASLPLSYGEIRTMVGSEGPSSSPTQPVSVAENLVAPDYFETIGIPILRGRGFDRDSGQNSVVVNETLARRFFQGQDPIGGQLALGDVGHSRSVQVVGVARDSKYRTLGEPPEPFLYERIDSGFEGATGTTVLLRTSVPPKSLTSSIRSEVRMLDGSLPITRVETMEEHIRSALWLARTTAMLLCTVGTLGVLLAMIGLYGAVAYSVARRTKEIGIRMALGAHRIDVLTMVVRDGLTLTLAGVSIGLLGALALTRFLGGLLYGMSATDPLTFVAATMLLGAVALLASYIPARRAAKVDPMVALRYE